MNKLFKTIFMFFSILSIGCSYTQSGFKDTNFKTAKIQEKIINTEKGFGYEIYVNDKLYINQTVIPGLKPYRAFSSSDDARKAATLVIEKLRKEIIPPKISEEELIQLNIKY